MGQPHILILGPPGAGKGTQSGNIAEEYGIEHVTTGDALRGNKDMDISDMDTEYDTPRAYMEAGDLVPDAVVNAIVEEALSAADGFVLDGYPRNLEQAEELSGMTDIDVVLSLEVSREELVDRLSGRRVCDGCGANFHVEFDQPAEEGICDGCGGELEQREDDRPEAVENRLDVFDENTTPVIEQYQDHEGFVAIDGEQPPAEVWGAIDSAVRGRADVSE
jgi:adenylate kinase